MFSVLIYLFLITRYSKAEMCYHHFCDVTNTSYPGCIIPEDLPLYDCDGICEEYFLSETYDYERFSNQLNFY